MNLEEATKERTEMANIAFVPTCSKCLTPIFNTAVGVTTEYMDELYVSKKLYMTPYLEVHPEECPHCGTLFKNMIYPDSQHLDNEGMVVFTEKLINKNLSLEEDTE